MNIAVKSQILIGVAISIVLLPSLVFAGPIVRSGKTVSVDADQVLEGDFYGAGNTVLLSGEAQYDVYVAGGSITINSPVAEDLVIVGGTVQVHGVVEDDLRVAGGEVTIANDVRGDVAVFGGTLNVLSTASIDGDVLFFGGDLDISGDVKGSVFGFADTIRIDSSVGGDVDVTARSQFSLGSQAEVFGSVRYKSANDVARAQEAVVIGDLNREELSQASGSNRISVIAIFMLLFAAFTIFLLRKSYLQKVVDITKFSYGIQGIIGLVVFVVIPATSLLLMVSVLGFILGAVLLLSYIILILLTWVIAGVVLGTLVLQPLTKTTKVSLMSVIIGIILLEIIALIPFIGPLLVLVLLLVTMGGIVKIVYSRIR